MDCRVVVEAAVPVYDVETADEAIRIAISKTGEMLNPDLNYVEISMAERTTPAGEELPPAFIAADEALVALELEMSVFNVEHDEHASRIARKEIGQRLQDIPLKVLHVEELEESDDDTEEGSDDDDDDTSRTEDEDGEPTGTNDEEITDGRTESDTEGDEDLIPEFEELVEDS